MEKTLCSIDVAGQAYFLSTTVEGALHDSTFHIVLIDADSLSVWEGELSDDMQKLAKTAKLDVAEYVSQTRKALSRQDMGDLMFEYQVKNGKRAGVKELSWKKVVSSIKFQLGSVQLSSVDRTSQSISDILQHSIQNTSKLKGAISRLEMENERLSNERSQALKRLEKCVVLKDSMEQDLYAKFAAILNEKKAKIRQLRNQGSASVESDGDARGQRSAHPISDDDEPMDEGDDDVDTDEERGKSSSSHKRTKKAVGSSSRSTKDDSLILDESPDEPAHKARRRVREPTSKKTTSSQKPSVPRVPSGGTPSTSRTPSMRKTPSRERSQRSGDPDDDVDKLFEDM